MKRTAFIAAAGLVIAVTAVLIVRQQVSSPRGAADVRQKFDVLLITLDTIRADRITPSLTPHLERLAARGVRFTNVRATAPLTLPSHTSIMTGVTPPVHAVHENGVVFNRKLPTLARTLRESGYATGAFVGAYVLNRRFGLDEGFDTYDDAVRRDGARAEQLEAERPAGEVVNAAVKWLEGAAASKPTFTWVHLYDAHAPYTPAKVFLEQARGNAYDGEIAYVDAEVGRLLAALDQRHLSDNTVVVVAGDHGEALGEHGEDTHGMLVYDATLRVPLIVFVPGGKTGITVDGAVSLTQVAPAILSAVGVTTAANRWCDAGILQTPDAPAAVSGGCDVFSESRYPRRAGWHALSALLDGEWKLVLSSERELYDLRADAAEQKNVAPERPNVVQAMAARIDAIQNSASSESSQIAPEAAERLRALGYVSGPTAISSDDPQAPNPARLIGSWTDFEVALNHLQAGRPAAALSRLGALAKSNPRGPVFQTTYARALKDAGRAKDAVGLYKAAASRWPGDATLFHDLAVAAREAGDLDEALRAEQAALALDGNSAMAQNGMGLLHADAGRASDAATAFEKAVTSDPTNPSYWTNLGNARRAMNDGARAEAAYRKALTLDEGFADALNGLGTLMVHSGHAQDAVPLFTRAIARDPGFHEARLNLGIAYQQSGQIQKAAEVYREVLQKTPPRFARERAAAGQLLKSIK